MSPENALIARLGKAISPHAAAFNVALTDKKARAALKALGIPLPVLAWCAANPEAAKGLASGEMVATLINLAMFAASTLVTSDEAQGEISADDAEFGMSDHRPGWEPCVEVTCTYSFAKNGRGCPRCGKLMVDFGD